MSFHRSDDYLNWLTEFLQPVLLHEFDSEPVKIVCQRVNAVVAVHANRAPETGALQDAARFPISSRRAVASWTAAALRRYYPPARLAGTGATKSPWDYALEG